MSSRMFQGVLLQLSEAAQTTIGVIDAEGNVISCSDTTLIGEKWPDAATAVAAMLDYAWETLRGAGYTPYYLYRQKYMSGGFENVGWCRLCARNGRTGRDACAHDAGLPEFRKGLL